MTTAVKIFSYRGVVSAINDRPGQAASDSILLLSQPYEAREALSATGTAVSSSAATAPSKTTLLRVEVADGGTIRYEVNPPGRNVAADANSPRLSGVDLLLFGSEFTLSVIEA